MGAVLRVCAALLALLGVTTAAAAERPPLVLAAASLQESLTEAAAAFADKGNPRPVLSFAASSALARQVESGAPADLFVSADEAWMDYLHQRRLIRPGTRVSFLANRLVLIAPAGRPLKLAIRSGFPLAAALGDGRLVMADPDAVPAGRYGRAALVDLGVWRDVEARIVRAENVRSALLFVERGAARAGIVYATDAMASKGVGLVDAFPEPSHPPIAYPVATLARSKSAAAERFRRFLISKEGKAIFVRHGFIPR